MRPQEVPFLRGDSTKFRNKFKNFEFQYDFEKLMNEMIDYGVEKLK